MGPARRANQPSNAQQACCSCTTGRRLPCRRRLIHHLPWPILDLQSSSRSTYRSVDPRPRASNAAEASSAAPARGAASPSPAGPALLATSPSGASFAARLPPPTLAAADWQSPRWGGPADMAAAFSSGLGVQMPPAIRASLQAHQAAALQQADAQVVAAAGHAAASHVAAAAAASYTHLPLLAVTLQQHSLAAAAAAEEALQAELAALAAASLRPALQLPALSTAPQAALACALQSAAPLAAPPHASGAPPHPDSEQAAAAAVDRVPAGQPARQQGAPADLDGLLALEAAPVIGCACGSSAAGARSRAACMACRPAGRQVEGRWLGARSPGASIRPPGSMPHPPLLHALPPSLQVWLAVGRLHAGGPG